MGFVVFAVIGLYLLISTGVAIGSIVDAGKAGKSLKHWGWGAALAMGLIIRKRRIDRRVARVGGASLAGGPAQDQPNSGFLTRIS